jgi:hypothetical protein
VHAWTAVNFPPQSVIGVLLLILKSWGRSVRAALESERVSLKAAVLIQHGGYTPVELSKQRWYL